MPWLTETAPSGETVRRFLVIPVEYLRDVSGALDALGFAYNWEQSSGGQTPDDAALLMAQMVDAYYMNVVEDDISGGITNIPVWFPSASPNGWVFVALGSDWLGGGWETTSSAQNDSVTFTLVIGAGTWSMRFMTPRGNNQGIATFFLDGVSVGATDMYLASAARNISRPGPTLTIQNGGSHTLQIKIATKNAASSGFGFHLQALTLRQTA